MKITTTKPCMDCQAECANEGGLCGTLYSEDIEIAKSMGIDDPEAVQRDHKVNDHPTKLKGAFYTCTKCGSRTEASASTLMLAVGATPLFDDDPRDPDIEYDRATEGGSL